MKRTIITYAVLSEAWTQTIMTEDWVIIAEENGLVSFDGEGFRFIYPRNTMISIEETDLDLVDNIDLEEESDNE
jgi:hypothetical protein